VHDQLVDDLLGGRLVRGQVGQEPHNVSTSIALLCAAPTVVSAGHSGSSAVISAFLTTGRCNTIGIGEMPAR